MEVIEPLPEHVFDFVRLTKRFIKEGINGEEWGFNEEDVHTTYHQWNKKDWGFMLVSDEKIVGILAGQISPHFFDYSNIFFHEYMWYVEPEYRKSGGGILLYRAMLRRCREKCIKRIVMGHTRDMIKEFEAIYKKLGFTYLQTHYEKVI